MKITNTRIQINRLTATSIMLFMFLVLFGGIVQAKEYAIKDMQKTDEAYEQVQWALNQGYMGLSLGKFLPNNNVRRSEFAVILAKINGDSKKLDKPSASTFLDVKTKDQFFRYIETEKDIMTSFKSAKGKMFKPDTYLTREDACLSIVKVMGYDNEDADADPDISLGDIIQDSGKVSPAITRYVALAVQNELITLREDADNQYVDPRKNITRKDLAVLIYNAYQNKDLNKSDDSSDSKIDSTDDTSIEEPDLN